MWPVFFEGGLKLRVNLCKAILFVCSIYILWNNSFKSFLVTRYSSLYSLYWHNTNQDSGIRCGWGKSLTKIYFNAY